MDVRRIMDKIMAAVEGEDDTAVVMGCLTLAVTNQLESDFTLEQMKTGVTGASEWIALYASTLDPQSASSKIN